MSLKKRNSFGENLSKSELNNNFDDDSIKIRHHKRSRLDESDGETSASTSDSKKKKKHLMKKPEEIIDHFNGGNSPNETLSGDDEMESKQAPIDINLKRVNDFLTFISSQEELIKKKKGNVYFSTLLNGEELKNWPEVDKIQRFYRTTYSKAAAVRNTPLKCALNRVIDFINEDQYITNHPDFPKLPANSYHLMTKKLGLSVFGKTGEAKRRLLEADDPLTIETKREAELDKIRFNKDLEKFLKKYRDSILPEHIAFIQRKLKVLNKEADKNKSLSESKRAKNKVKEKKEKLTAFDYFKLSKKHKYLDLSSEEREAKLKKRFEKLEEDKKKIFEALASNESIYSD